MKRVLWAGAAVLVAAIVAVPLWLATDDDGPRRAGALVAPTAAGDIGRLTLVGSKSGTTVLQVRSFDLEVKAPRDVATGQATNKVTYAPLGIIKPIDATSPAMLKLIAGAEPITSAKLELMASSAEGKQGVYATYDFSNAILRSWGDGTEEKLSLGYQGVTSKLGSLKPPAAADPVIGQMTYQGTVVPITGFDTSVEAPVDPASGLLSGKRKHNPVSVVHAFDATAPTALANTKGNTPLGQIKIELQRQSAEGKVVTYATYTYANAFSAGVNDSGAAGRGASQRLEFTYGSIEVSVGGAVATDSVSAPVS